MTDPNFDPKSSILFLGSGFTKQATNIIGENPPIGDGLRDQFAALLGEKNTYELKDLADVIAESPDHDLYKILYNDFTIKNLPDSHRLILSQPWRRIYTTNYDDAVEYYYSESERTPNSYSVSENTPKHRRSNDIVHLHGYIRKCTPESVSEELILGHKSYVEERLKSSPWYDLFSSDLDNARDIFFVGYSLLDFNITAYLMKNPALTKKSAFIIHSPPDRVFRTRVEPYGSIHPISVEGFSKWCSNIQPLEDIANPKRLRSFKFLDPLRDDRVPSKPTSPEIQDLMTLGHFNFSRLVATYPKSDYVVLRQNMLEETSKELEAHKTVVLHGHAGNGKTIFKNTLAIKLARSDHLCFEYKFGMEIPENELDYLRRISPRTPPVIFFSSYDDFRAVISMFSDMPDKTRYILEMDTGTFFVRQNELAGMAHGNLGKIDLNRLKNEDTKQLQELLDRAGILRRNEFATLRHKHAQMRDYVLNLFNNDAVRKKIETITGALVENSSFKKFLYVSFIVRILDVDLSLVFLRKVTNIDPYDCLRPEKDFKYVRDLFEITDTTLQPRSAILVEFILKELLDQDEILKWILELSFYAAEVKAQELVQSRTGNVRFKEANHLLGSAFKDSNLKIIFGNNRLGNDKINKIYERGRRDTLINKEPLFWLQYCIFQMRMGELKLAEEFLNTAFDRASDIEGFRTYQIDTYALSLYLKMEEAAPSASAVSRFEAIYDKLEQVKEMIGDGNHRNFALLNLSKIEKFVQIRLSGLQEHEKVRMIYLLNLITDRLSGLPIEVKMQFATEKVKESLISATNLLIA